MTVNKYILKAIKTLVDNPKYSVSNNKLNWKDERELPDLDKLTEIANSLKLQDLKQSKKQEIENAYLKAIQEPIVYNNYTFQADLDSQKILSQIIAVALDGFEIDWLDIDNNLVHLTLDDLKAAAGLILARGQEMFVKKVALKKQIEQCDNKECLEQIKWD